MAEFWVGGEGRDVNPEFSTNLLKKTFAFT